MHSMYRLSQKSLTHFKIQYRINQWEHERTDEIEILPIVESFIFSKLKK